MPSIFVLSIVASHLVQAAQTVESWSPVPILSFGALVSVCTAAVGYGALRGKVQSTAENHTNLSKKVDTIDTKVDRLAESLARVEGHLGTSLKRATPRDPGAA